MYFYLRFVLHISAAQNRSLPDAHHEEVCEGLSNYRVEVHTASFFQIFSFIVSKIFELYVCIIVLQFSKYFIVVL